MKQTLWWSRRGTGTVSNTTFEILKSLRSDIQMLYRGSITESMVYHLLSFFIIFSWPGVCPIFLWLNHVKSHYFIVNCQFLMVTMGNFCGAPRYFTATWDDQLPMEINKIFPRNGERPMPRVSWRRRFSFQERSEGYPGIPTTIDG